MWRPLTFVLLVAVAAGVTGGGCDESPNQQAVNNAEKRAEQATQQVEKAHEEVKHVQRLRDIDKMKYEAQSAEMQTTWSFWRLWLIALAVLLVIVLVWLAREIRFRRVLGHVLVCIRRQQQGGEA